MEISFSVDMTSFNLALIALCALIPGTFLLLLRRAEFGTASANRYSHRAALPFGSDETFLRVRSRVRRQTRISMVGFLLVLAAAVPLVIWSPFGGTSWFLWIVTVSASIFVVTTSSVLVTVREELRRRDPSSPRVAQTARLRTADYLQPWRRVVAPIALSAGAALTLLVIAERLWRPAWLSLENVVVPVTCLGFALIVLVGTRVLESVVLSRPQRARDELELAWEDLFRAEALSSLRMAAAMAAALPVGFALGTLALTTTLQRPVEPTETVYMGPLVAISIVQVLSALGEGTMPAARYPAGSPRSLLARTPVAGGAA